MIFNIGHIHIAAVDASGRRLPRHSGGIHSDFRGHAGSVISNEGRLRVHGRVLIAEIGSYREFVGACLDVVEIYRNNLAGYAASLPVFLVVKVNGPVQLAGQGGA